MAAWGLILSLLVPQVGFGVSIQALAAGTGFLP